MQRPNGTTSSRLGAAMDTFRRATRTVTGPAAQRTYLRLVLFAATTLGLLLFAALAYLAFYYVYIPQKLVTIPIHLQYNTGLNPFGVTSISPSLMLEQAYDVSVELTVPRSPSNMEMGNFMVALFAMKSLPDNPAYTFNIPADPYEHVTSDNVIFSSRRPAIIPYNDPLVSTASRLMFILYHIFFPESERSHLTIAMGELVQFNKQLPLSLLVDVQAGQTLQVYQASITLVARLSGLRWAMYNHRVISFVVFTTAFWLFEMLTMAVAWLVLIYSASDEPGVPESPTYQLAGGRSLSLEKSEEDTRFSSTSDATRTWTSAGGSQSGRIKAEGKEEEDDDYDDIKIKQESSDQETLADQTRYKADADDEGEEDVAGSTGYQKGAGNLRRRSSRDYKAT